MNENINEFEKNEFEQKLKAYMVQNGISGDFLEFTESCHSVEDAARALETSPDRIVKNICLIGDNQLIVAVLKGEDRVDRSLVAKILGLNKVKIASPDEIIDKAGYPCGGVPSFGFEAVFLIDSRVMERDMVYSGGGSTTSLLAITPSEIVKANKGVVAHIRK